MSLARDLLILQRGQMFYRLWYNLNSMKNKQKPKNSGAINKALPTCPWWRHAVIYQVYPRSFQDSNDDGIGDIRGIISRLDYIASLGVDAIWLSPVYVSPNHDYGYDIADYRNINPEYGTMADMERLIAEARKRHLKIIMDLVINHTSDQHEWFQKSLDVNSPYHNYYIWQPGKQKRNGKLLPPNNWTSIFTGPAWTYMERPNQFYLHLFTAGQPDLNYHNPDVIKEIKGVLNFWLDKGVAGFRCDVINLLYEESLDDTTRPTTSGGGGEYYISTPCTHKVLRELYRDVLGPRQAFTVGELYDGTINQARIFTSGNELDTVFCFDHAKQGLGSRNMTKRLKEGLIAEQTGLNWNTVFFENHDQQRSASVYGQGEYREQVAKMLATILFTLRGTSFVYQGEEIGMSDAKFEFDELKDPVATIMYQTLRKMHAPKWLARKMGLRLTRDYARTPMQWSDNDNAGFSGHQPWLKLNPNYKEVSVEKQDNDESSVLNYYRQLIALKKSSLVLLDGEIRFVDDKKDVLVYLRTLGEQSILVVANLSHRKVRAQTKIVGELLVDSYGDRDGVDNDNLLRPYEVVVTSLK